MTDPENSPVALLTEVMTSMHLDAAVVDFDALRVQLRAEPDVILAYVEDRPDLVALNPVEAFVEVVDVIEASGEDAGKVALVELLNRFDGAFGEVVPQRAPTVRAEQGSAGWSPQGILEYVTAIVGDALAGYSIDRDEIRENRKLVERLVEKTKGMAAAGKIPARLAGLMRQMPAVLDLLLGHGPERAQERLDELPLASRSGLLDFEDPDSRE